MVLDGAELSLCFSFCALVLPSLVSVMQSVVVFKERKERERERNSPETDEAHAAHTQVHKHTHIAP